VHEPEELLPAARELAASFIRGRSSAALAMARRLIYAGAGSAHPLEAHRRDSLAMWHASVGDGKEGVAAFLEKRSPRFTGTVHDIPALG
jgi:enoyl-CoA hydratase/carnithine racemase